MQFKYKSTRLIVQHTSGKNSSQFKSLKNEFSGSGIVTVSLFKNYSF